MGHLSLSKIAQEFSHMELVARCYSQIFAWCGFAKCFEAELVSSEAVLQGCQPEEWMKVFQQLRERGDLKAVQAFLKEDFFNKLEQLKDLCRELKTRRKVKGVDIFCFNRTVNLMLSLCSETSVPEEQINEVCKVVSEVLALYPDNGYDPDKDDFYEERVLEGRGSCGDREIVLREKQVIAEQNMLLKGLSSKR